MTIPNAGTTCRMGWCHGFEEIGIPYLLLSVDDLAPRLPELPGPIVWISSADYASLDETNFRALQKSVHVVWVNTWFDGEEAYYEGNRFQNWSDSPAVRQKVLASEPSFLFTISPEWSFHFYEGWVKQGGKLLSLPLACDTSVYSAQGQHLPELEGIELAFVGGYWPYKALQLDRYLRPYEERLKVFGYSPWPYPGYGGRISSENEAALYRQAKLSPSINEPHVEKMGIDINERVFKVLGSGGITITDVTPAYREWFADDELLVPGTVEEYHEILNEVLGNDQLNSRYRAKGFGAVLSRHTYAHRAQVLLLNLELAIGGSQTVGIEHE